MSKTLFKLAIAPTFPGTVTITDPDGTSQQLDCTFKYVQRDERKKILEADMTDWSDLTGVLLQVLQTIANYPEGQHRGLTEEDKLAGFLRDLLQGRPWAFRDIVGTWIEALETGRTKN